MSEDKMASAFPVVLLLCFMTACWAGDEGHSKVILKERVFGYIGKKPVKIYTWKNANGMELEVITYGGRIRSIKLPDRKGKIVDIVLGYDKLSDYQKDNTYFGAILGRTANRIVGASYILNGKKYKLTANQHGDSFHGGTKSFSHVIWEPHVCGTALTLSYYSADGEEGYGGNVVINVIYELTEDNTVVFKARAVTTKPTPIMIANHAYYNLAGHDAGAKGTYEHKVRVNAEKLVVYNAAYQPTGEIEDVKNTCNDFLTPRNLGKMMKKCGSYDIYLALDGKLIGKTNYMAGIEHEKSGLILQIYSNQNGGVLYTGLNLPNPKIDQPVNGKGGAKYWQNASICFETHGYPDAVHHENFPSVILYPGEVYIQNTYYKFSTGCSKE